jgi:SAM-dependent methyltransferase
MTSADWDRRYATPDLVWSREPNRFVAAESADLTPGRALDLGCGEGRNAVWLAGRGWRVTAVDFSGVALGKARRLSDAEGVAVDWVQADLTAAPAAPQSADLVVIAYVHLPPAGRRRMLAGAAAALAPGGTIIVVEHDLLNLTEGHGGPRDPDVLTTPEMIVAELPGLVVEMAERVRRPVEGAERDAIDTLVRASRPPD